MARIPQVERRTGKSADMDETIVIDDQFKVVFVRVHFRADPAADSPSSTPADLTISLDSIGGDQYNTTLYTFSRDSGRGIGADANLVITNEEMASPSPWGFPGGSGIRFQWTNPGGVEWGIELGYDPLGI